MKHKRASKRKRKSRKSNLIGGLVKLGQSSAQAKQGGRFVFDIFS